MGVGCGYGVVCVRVATECFDLVRAALQWYVGKVSRSIRLAFVLLWAGLIWFASSQPGTDIPRAPVVSILWNSAHVVVFGVLSGLILLSTQGCTRRRCFWAVAISAGYGVLDEFHQQQVKGRVMDFWDVCSDALGASIVVCGLVWLLTGNRQAAVALAPLLVLAAGSVLIAAG